MNNQTDDQQFKIRDLRQKEKFVVDDEYLNGYARLCGYKATLVYISLCRHASKEQTSFPSIRLMAEELRVSEDVVGNGIKDLKRWNVIRVKATYRKDGGRSSNLYILLDKSLWKQKSTPHTAVNGMPPTAVSGTPRRSHHSTHTAHNGNKDTHIKDTHIKEKEINKEKALVPLNGKHSSLAGLSETEFQQIANDYQVPLSFVISKFDDLQNYCLSNGKKYKDYLAALRNFVKQDAIRIGKEASQNVSKRGIDARNL